jgi:hypothetical protein
MRAQKIKPLIHLPEPQMNGAFTIGCAAEWHQQAGRSKTTMRKGV